MSPHLKLAVFLYVIFATAAIVTLALTMRYWAVEFPLGIQNWL